MYRKLYLIAILFLVSTPLVFTSSDITPEPNPTNVRGVAQEQPVEREYVFLAYFYPEGERNRAEFETSISATSFDEALQIFFSIYLSYGVDFESMLEEPENERFSGGFDQITFDPYFMFAGVNDID